MENTGSASFSQEESHSSGSSCFGKATGAVLSWCIILIVSLALCFLDCAPSKNGLVKEFNTGVPLGDVVVTRSILRVIPKVPEAEEVLLMESDVKTDHRGRYRFPLRLFLRNPLISSIRGDRYNYKKKGYIHFGPTLSKKLKENETGMVKIIERSNPLNPPAPIRVPIQ